MGDKIVDMLMSIFTIAAGVAIVALVLSNRSNTVGVLQSWFSGNSNLLATATAPVTGAKVNVNTSYPGAGIANPMGDLSMMIYN